MKFLEKDLEQIVFEADPALIQLRGLDCYGGFQKRTRQLNLGKYGISDIITFNFCKNEVIEVTVYELKQDVINAGTLIQALGYCKGVEQLFNSVGTFNHTLIFSIVLIGGKIDTTSNFCYLPDYISEVSLYTYSYEFDGIYFQERGDYSLNESGFSTNTQIEISNLLSKYGGVNTEHLEEIPTEVLSQEDKDNLPF